MIKLVNADEPMFFIYNDGTVRIESENDEVCLEAGQMDEICAEWIKHRGACYFKPEECIDSQVDGDSAKPNSTAPPVDLKGRIMWFLNEEEQHYSRLYDQSGDIWVKSFLLFVKRFKVAIK